MTRDGSADFGPDRVEYVVPLVVRQAGRIVPRLDMSIPRHVGPKVVTVGGKMQSLGIGVSEARKCAGQIEWNRAGRHNHRIIHRATLRAYSMTNVSVTTIDLIGGATRGGGKMNTKKTTKSRVEAGMHVDLAGRRTYSEYLKLDRLFAAQQPVSQEHDEVAFIIIHHVQELWLKLVAHEIEAAMNSIRADHLPPAFKSLARVTRIQEQLITAWDVLSTITPADYLAFRSALGPASGFQSYQYRLVEFRLGAKDPEMLLPHRHDPIVHAKLTAVLNEPSLYDEALHLLARRGHPVPKEVLARDFSQPYLSNPLVRDIWLSIYRQSQEHFDVYELAEELVDVEDWFQQWRFRHMKTVERIIGNKPGTGGSSGVGYLKTALERSFFPELWEVRTLL